MLCYINTVLSLIRCLEQLPSSQKDTIAEPHNKLSKASHNFHLGLSSRHCVESCECRIKKLNGVELMHFAYRRDGNSILKETLKPLLPARSTSSDGASCMAGTRTSTLRKIDKWIGAKSSTTSSFWVHRTAGSGKSAIACTICE